MVSKRTCKLRVCFIPKCSVSKCSKIEYFFAMLFTCTHTCTCTCRFYSTSLVNVIWSDAISLLFILYVILLSSQKNPSPCTIYVHFVTCVCRLSVVIILEPCVTCVVWQVGRAWTRTSTVTVTVSVRSWRTVTRSVCAITRATCTRTARRQPATAATPCVATADSSAKTPASACEYHVMLRHILSLLQLSVCTCRCTRTSVSTTPCFICV